MNRTDPDPPKQGAKKDETVELLVELNVYPAPTDIIWEHTGITNGSDTTTTLTLPSDEYDAVNTGNSSKLIIKSMKEEFFWQLYTDCGKQTWNTAG